MAVVNPEFRALINAKLDSYISSFYKEISSDTHPVQGKEMNKDSYVRRFTILRNASSCKIVRLSKGLARLPYSTF